jgi:acetyl esterase/lipase
MNQILGIDLRQIQSLIQWLLFFWSAIGLFLSIWIVIPAPTFALLPLGVGAPEVSPWLLGLNSLGVLLSLSVAQKDWLSRIALGLSIAGVILSALPLSQFPTTNQRMEAAMTQALGINYMADIQPAVRAKLRPQPFILTDALLGITVGDVRYTPEVEFAMPEQVSLRLDVYRPRQVGIYPAIVVIHGGAWRSGSPQDNAMFSRYMAAQGYVVWAIAYRLAPRYQFPAQLEDVQTALTFIRQHAAEYETDAMRMALLGRSAGAHLALLAAYHPDAPPLKAVVNYYGPINLTAGYYDLPHPDPIDTRAVLRTFLGGTPEEKRDRYKSASPINYVTRPMPPSLLVYGGRDHLVMAKFGRKLFDQLRQVGSTAIFLEIPWAEHAFDAVFNGVSNQLALYYTERFLAWALR